MTAGHILDIRVCYVKEEVSNTNICYIYIFLIYLKTVFTIGICSI